MIDWSKVFTDALPYTSFLDQYASPAHRARWDAMHGRFSLAVEQRELLKGFSRRMPVLCLTGAWCGDCINQCPAFDHLRGHRQQSTCVFSTATPIPIYVIRLQLTAATVYRSSSF